MNDDVTISSTDYPTASSSIGDSPQPRRIGRYRIEKLLGKGGFGLVYLAHDEQLDRPVAVKVPHAKLISRPEDAEAYLAEARTVAGLDHPNIVPVHDVGSTEDCPCFIVSKYIEGVPLTERIKLNRPSAAQSAELVATIAEALHYAHRKKLVHRDIKPGNILIDTTGTPFVVDFGMALKEENIGKGLGYVGTPAYMSPEQARGEGHRVDGRSDIFSLGVVFYELLTRHRPFTGDSQAELLEQIQSCEPRPPRQHDDGIPKELERICMKALAKRASERYTTAKDMADDLRHWISTQDVVEDHHASTEGFVRLSPDQVTQIAQAVKGGSSKTLTPSSGTLSPATPSPTLHIVPRGLRSFDAHDADFFLELLPGPRDREGLPDSIRFWKTRIEETDADNTFAVGLALLRMNQPAKVWPLLKHSTDPRVRSYLIHRLGPMGADAGAIVRELDIESDLTIRRALILSLGEFGETEFTPDARNALLPKLQEMYRTASDPGLHAACEWLLRRWKQDAWVTQVNEAWAKDKEQRDKRLEGIGKDLGKEKEKTPPQWYVNTQGQTFVVIPGPVEFTMGSPLTEEDRAGSETQHPKRIGRTFALGMTAVTKERFLRFQPKYIGLVSGSTEWMLRYPEPTCPIGGFDWYDAAAYCNWLSKEEGIPEDQWCYEIKGTAVTLKAKYLSLSGYRLPTEAEMEYATRAGAVTSRYYGETDELLPKYAWYFKNSQARTWPVGSLKPNDLGLFDAQGNLYTWCQERHKEYPAGKGDGEVEDQEDELVVTSTDRRVLRGGSFSDPASHVRSAYRDLTVPADRDLMLGFRLARTLPFVPLTPLPLPP